MKIVFLLAREPDMTIKTIITETGKDHETVITNLSECRDYEALVEEIEKCDRVITW